MGVAIPLTEANCSLSPSGNEAITLGDAPLLLVGLFAPLLLVLAELAALLLDAALLLAAVLLLATLLFAAPLLLLLLLLLWPSKRDMTPLGLTINNTNKTNIKTHPPILQIWSIFKFILYNI